VEDMCYENQRRAEALVCVLLLQDLLQSCSRGGGRIVESLVVAGRGGGRKPF